MLIPSIIRNNNNQHCITFQNVINKSSEMVTINVPVGSGTFVHNILEPF